MTTTRTSHATDIRSRLDHPILDADGHIVEVNSLLLEYVKQAGGIGMVDRWVKYAHGPRTGDWLRHRYVADSPAMTLQERKETWVRAPGWWGFPAENTLDRMTTFLPRLLAERLDDMAIDFAIIYPTVCLGVNSAPGIEDDELRRAMCRAYNLYAADLYGEFSDRMAMAAVIPMHTPQEAIEELEYAVRTLGLKTAMIPGHVVRRTPERASRRFPALPFYVDKLAMDSDYDYDPVWAKFVELGVAPGVHSFFMHSLRVSPSRYMFDIINAFSAAHDLQARAFFMGGVTRRFPGLRMAFLEGGAAIGALLLGGMVRFWEKRNAKTIESLDPARLDLDLVSKLIDEYGDERFARIKDNLLEEIYPTQRQTFDPRTAFESLDDFYAAGIDPDRPEQFRELFDRFFWGCEADDPTTRWAFDSEVNPFGTKVRAMLSSDISHFDVSDMTEVVPEAYELVEKGLISQDDFRDFAFLNQVRMYAGMNPDFYKGTRVEAAVDKVLRTENL